MNTKMKVLLNTVDKVKAFAAISGAIPNEIDVGHDRFQVNGKSIMGLFSLDLDKPLNLTVYGEIDPKHLDQFKPFCVQEA